MLNSSEALFGKIRKDRYTKADKHTPLDKVFQLTQEEREVNGRDLDKI